MAFIFYFNIVLTGVAIAAASWHFAAMIGAPTPRIYPVISERFGPGSAVALWLLSGPIALMRFGISIYTQVQPMVVFSALAAFAAIAWAFCLGVVVLEIIFQLFLA